MEVTQVKSKKKKVIVAGVIFLIILVVALNVYLLQRKQNGSAADLKFTSVTERELSSTKLIAGQVVPGKQETIYADPTLGKVKEFFVNEGQEVKKGQKLFSYENTELSSQIKQLALDKQSASMRYDQGKNKMASLKDQIQKAKDAGAAKEVTDPLESQLQDLELQQKTTELEIEKLQLQSEDLQRKQNDLTVYSTTDGMLQKVNKEAGGQSTSQAAAIQAAPLIQIASKDPFKVEGTLSELQKAQIQPNQPITITAKAIQDKKWSGKITEVSQYPTADQTGQGAAIAAGQTAQNISYYPFTASLDSQDGLAPGYHVSIQVKLTSKKLLAIPRSSIIEKGNSPYVFVVKKNKLHKQTITMGMGDGEWTEVLEGLKAGEKIVKNPSASLKDGMDVNGK
ncbi:efflux RND transporter periplasmic adaptor subunit [Neobacillus sp. SM06]|uniref:efflux RND transporter periplasmic adaptor subunit n=1 Tax=Neobacillus sp. SM06 TaxID=3422492 RepID=UPI003D2CE5B9